jgi:maltooligosyltrehalose trehalohydrolase
LRRCSASLNDARPGQVKAQFDENKRWMVMERGSVTVICNLGSGAVELENTEKLSMVLASRTGVEVRGSKVVLPSDSLVILSGETKLPVV